MLERLRIFGASASITGYTVDANGTVTFKNPGSQTNPLLTWTLRSGKPVAASYTVEGPTATSWSMAAGFKTGDQAAMQRVSVTTKGVASAGPVFTATVPAPTPPPPPPPPPASGLQIGVKITANWPQATDAAVQAMKPAVARIDYNAMGAASSATAIKDMNGRGISTMLLLSTYTTSAATVAAFCKANPGIKWVEVGNEDAYSYQNASATAMKTKAGSYAKQVQAIATALQGTGVLTLCQADNGMWQGSTWVDAMFATVPNLTSYAAGWIIHPYGMPGSSMDPATRINTMISQTGAHSVPASFPIFITEYGIATDNGNKIVATSGTTSYEWPLTLTYAQAGTALVNVVKALDAEFPQLAAFIVFENIDEADPGINKAQDDHFGVIDRNFTPKAGFADALAALTA